MHAISGYFCSGSSPTTKRVLATLATLLFIASLISCGGGSVVNPPTRSFFPIVPTVHAAPPVPPVAINGNFARVSNDTYSFGIEVGSMQPGVHYNVPIQLPPNATIKQWQGLVSVTVPQGCHGEFLIALDISGGTANPAFTLAPRVDNGSVSYPFNYTNVNVSTGTGNAGLIVSVTPAGTCEPNSVTPGGLDVEVQGMATIQ